MNDPRYLSIAECGQRHLETPNYPADEGEGGWNTQVKALADMTQLSQLFHTYTTVKDAEAALAQMVG